jgi:hypothetical protein
LVHKHNIHDEAELLLAKMGSVTSLKLAQWASKPKSWIYSVQKK